MRPEDRARFEELLAIPDEELTVEEALEAQRIVWPGYFADPATAPPMPDTLMRVDAFLETSASVDEVQPGLAAGLPGLHVPFAFVHGLGSPMPVIESSASVDLLPDAELEVVEGAGHFIWHERPGAVRAGLDRLAARTSD